MQVLDCFLVRNEERPHELAGNTGWSGRGKEMKKSVESRDQEGEAEKETGDDRRTGSHVSVCFDLKYIDINIIVVNK